MDSKAHKDSKRLYSQTLRSKGRDDAVADVADDFTESIDDLQIQLNQLHSQDIVEQFAALQFWAEYIESGQLIPPELMVQFRNDILAFLPLLLQMDPQPELQINNVLIIISDIVEFFEDDFDYKTLFQTIWTIMPNSDACDTCGQIINHSPTLAQEILGNNDYIEAIEGFLQNEIPEVRNSGLYLVVSLAKQHDNHILMHSIFDSVCQMLINENETDDNISTVLLILKLFADSEIGITFISEKTELGNMIHNVINPENTTAILNLLLNIGKTSSHCLKIFSQLDVLPFILFHVNNETSSKHELLATRILYCIAMDGQEGARFLVEAENGTLIPNLFEKINCGQSLWKASLATVCACCYKGDSEVIDALVGAGLFGYILENLESSSDSFLNDLILALQSIIANAERKGDAQLISELTSNEDLIDKLFNISDEKAGTDEGRIANFIYSKLTGEE